MAALYSIWCALLCQIVIFGTLSWPVYPLNLFYSAMLCVCVIMKVYFVSER